jgi:hypothetical protein
MTPGLVLDEITRNAVYPAAQLTSAIDVDHEIDIHALKRDLLQAVAEARDLFAELPLEQAGYAYVDRSGAPHLPHPQKVEAGGLFLHGATPGGAWPAGHLCPEPNRPSALP